MAPHIAILGGGLSGLSAAFHLARRAPLSTQITLLEASARLGGWVKSERLSIPDHNASMVLESGPRTLRASGQSVLELIHLLGLTNDVITVPKSSPAAKKRYLYLPDHGVIPISTSLLGLLFSPIGMTQLSTVLELFRKPNRPKGVTDESVHDFLSRRFGEEFARVFGSSIVHGIYAADSRVLSAQTAFPTFYSAEDRGNGSVLKGFLRPPKKEKKTYELGEVKELVNNASVYSFRDGIESLTYALARNLASRPNVDIHLNSPVQSITPETDTIMIEAINQALKPTHVVSALSLPTLSNILPSASTLPHLNANPYASVHVYQFIFPCSPDELHPAGFGYLVPRPKDDSENVGKPKILGTVFDSCSVSAQDENADGLTKLTVMVSPPLESTEPVPVEEILQTLATHLSPSDPSALPQPIHTAVHARNSCIPTPLPGHGERMNELKQVLEDEKGPWRGRMEVIGAAVGGISVPDCVEAGRGAGKAWF